MTRFRSRRAERFLILLLLALAGCATPSGEAVQRIAEPDIAAAYIPLQGKAHLGLDRAVAAAMVLLPGIAVTNAHNANLLDPGSVIGAATQSDLMFFRVGSGTPPAIAPPVVGERVVAYGEDLKAGLRMAHGTVRELVTAPGYADSPYFTFAGDAGEGFSGGPVVDASGRLIGIIFGYKDQGGTRLIFAYDMTRVQAEYSALSNRPPQGGN